MRPDAIAVAGIGTIVEQTPAHALWLRVEAAAGARIPTARPAGSLENARDQADLLRASALRSTLQHWSRDGRSIEEFVENYPVPARLHTPALPGGSPLTGEAWAKRYATTVSRALQLGVPMPFHDIGRSIVGEYLLGDSVWSGVFQRFENSPDMNSLLFFAEEGDAIRSDLGRWPPAGGETIQSRLSRQKASDDLRDAFGSLLLKRPAATEWLRELAAHVQDSVTTTRLDDGRTIRGPHGFKSLNEEGRIGMDTFHLRSAPTFTLDVPRPWSQFQMAQYDALPVLAWVYRPNVASFLDAAKARVPEAERVASLQAALRAAVDVSMGGLPPVRIFHDSGCDAGAASRARVFFQALRGVLPDFDLFDVKAGYDLAQRLGDTGVASAAVGVSVATLAAWETGSAALVVNLRRDDGATVLAVRPVNDAYRDQFKKRPYAPL
ncbi:MAG: hypothetical protein V4636_08280 [Pseudomonadota bacterium]